MTPSEVIAEALHQDMCGGPHDPREDQAVRMLHEDLAEAALEGIAAAGLVVVSAEDLYHVAEIAENYLDMCEPPPADELERVARFRAALPERTETDGQ